MRNKIILIFSTVIALLITFFTGAHFYKKHELQRTSRITSAQVSQLIPAYAPKIGPDSAKVKIVEFLDPECETCREFYPLVKSILNEAPDQIQLIIRYAPFHGNSKFAIQILEAARFQGKYWETLEVLFRYQPQWGDHHQPNPELIWKYLPEAGVDIKKIRIDMLNPSIMEMISLEEVAVGELSIRATPSFFVNDRPLEVFGLDPLRKMVLEALESR